MVADEQRTVEAVELVRRAVQVGIANAFSRRGEREKHVFEPRREAHEPSAGALRLIRLARGGGDGRLHALGRGQG